MHAVPANSVQLWKHQRTSLEDPRLSLNTVHTSRASLSFTSKDYNQGAITVQHLTTAGWVHSFFTTFRDRLLDWGSMWQLLLFCLSRRGTICRCLYVHFMSAVDWEKSLRNLINMSSQLLAQSHQVMPLWPVALIESWISSGSDESTDSLYGTPDFQESQEMSEGVYQSISSYIGLTNCYNPPFNS